MEVFLYLFKVVNERKGKDMVFDASALEYGLIIQINAGL